MDQILNVLVFGLLLGGIYGLVSIGLNLIFGVVRIVNFAQGELVAATPRHYSLRRVDPRAGLLHVHFPRIGYVLKQL